MKPPPIIVFIPDHPLLEKVEFKPEPKLTVCEPGVAEGAIPDNRVKPKRKGEHAD